MEPQGHCHGNQQWRCFCMNLIAAIPVYMTFARPPVAIVSVKYAHVKCFIRCLQLSFSAQKSSVRPALSLFSPKKRRPSSGSISLASTLGSISLASTPEAISLPLTPEGETSWRVDGRFFCRASWEWLKSSMVGVR